MGKKKTERQQEGVEFKMMFRHHQDPLYYDTQANAKIFVPQVIEGMLNETEKKIIASFPKEDRGEILEPEEYAKKGYGPGQGTDLNNLVELDQIEAAQKKHKLREAAAMIKAKRIKNEKGGIVKFKDEAENPYDSEENNYDAAKEYEEAGGSEVEENSYDSEFESEFFGKKDVDLNKELKNRDVSDDENADDQIDSNKQVYNPADFNESIK